MIKEIKYNGYTAVPSDYECPDGDLALATGVLPEDGTLKPVLEAGQLAILPAGYRIVFIHANTSGMKHYIILNTANAKFYWLDASVIDDAQAHPVPAATISSALVSLVNFGYPYQYNSINAVGNTLMIMDDVGIHHFLWKGSSYTNLGIHLPELPISFGLNCTMERSTLQGRIFAPAIPVSEAENGLTNDNKDLYTNEILGNVNKFIREQANRTGKFMYPFLVRYAYRLYDETLTMHSAPILMVASSDVSPIVAVNGTIVMDGKVQSIAYYVAAMLSQLKYRVIRNYDILSLQGWSDIVKSVDIFISAPIYTYNQSGYIEKMYVDYDNAYQDSFTIAEINDGEHEYKKRYAGAMYRALYGTLDDVVPIPSFSAEAVKGKIRDCHDFYLLTSVKVDNLTTSWTTISLEEDYLDSLQAREVMTDDYDSHDKLVPEYSYNYNSRLNIANITKDLFSGFTPAAMMPYAHINGYDSDWTAYVHIKEDYKEYVVKSDTSVLMTDSPVLMLYYPNPNAYKITLDNGITKREYPLEKHDFLRGAFFFQGWDDLRVVVYNTPTESVDKKVTMPNKIYTSEVNNPYLFLASGVNTVGIGSVKGMAAVVSALSERNFGKGSLFVFTSDGVWVMDMRQDGIFIYSHPTARDIVTNPESITSVDKAILYASQRGIMMLTDTSNRCISEELEAYDSFSVNGLPPVAETAAQNKVLQLAGVTADETTIVPWHTFLQGCRMLYDYTGQRIIVYNPSKSYAYVYSLKDNKWGMTPSAIKSGFNSYPDALVNSQGDGSIILEDWSNPNAQEERDGLIITRPLKLDYPDAMKTVRTVIQRGKFTSGNVQQILWGSRDLIHWYLVGSSTYHRMYGLSGTPYKYFRLGLPVSLAEGESLYGCTVEYEIKDTNKLR